MRTCFPFLISCLPLLLFLPSDRLYSSNLLITHLLLLLLLRRLLPLPSTDVPAPRPSNAGGHHEETRFRRCRRR